MDLYFIQNYFQWDLGCDENQWKLTLVGTVNSAGFLITMPFSGFISDR